jgi:DHA2 family multidrug resistance protein
VPLSQATLLDIYPPERRGFAMAIWSVGVMLGPIMGPTVGGWLTENYSWRWVFYINLPFGLLAAAGLLIFLPSSGGQGKLRFDWLGFGVLTIAIGGMQLMLDRGQDQDWFTSREIITEAVLACLGFYLFLVHVVCAREPLIRPAVFGDINFTSGLLLMFMVGVLMVSSLALMTPWLQVLSNYPVETAGLIMAPRGFGSLVTTILGGRLSGRVDARLLVGSGLVMLSYSFWLMTQWTPDVSEREIIIAVVIQGAAMGLVFSPLSVLAFVTLTPSMRTEGASLFSLLRNIGAAIGVSVFSSLLARNSQAMHEMIGASVTPFNRALQAFGSTGGDMHRWLDPATRHGAALLDRMVNQQAQVVAYADDYVMLILTTVPALMLLFLMRMPRKAVATPAE